MKKAISIFLVLTIVALSCSITASAGTKTVASSNQNEVCAYSGYIGDNRNKPYSPRVSTSSVTYNNSRELYAFFKDVVEYDVIIRFGFNTFATDEDYCYTYHSTKSHTASLLYNNSVGETSSQKPGGQWTSKIDMAHANPVAWIIRY